MAKHDDMLDQLERDLPRLVVKKKQLRYQIDKDVRFMDYQNMSIETLAYEYQKISTTIKQNRDLLVANGRLIDWSKEPE